MALSRPAPVAPVRPTPGSVSANTDDLNNLVKDINTQFDAVWAALLALDARVTALGG